MLATIAVSYGIPILSTRNAAETSALLLAIAKREQEGGAKDFAPHSEKKPLTIKEQQEYLISGLPNVGGSLAKDLLRQFKSVRNVINASEDELKQVDKVGEKIAKKIKDVVDSKYDQ
jgi:Fanconi anemia group M protein